MVVNEIPAPTLLVAAQQGHVPVALHRGRLGSDSHNGHRAERAFPPHLPTVPTVRETERAAGPVRALGNGVPVQRESVALDVDVARTVVWIPGVIEGAQLRLIGGHGAEQVRLEGLVGQSADAVQAPHVVVLVVQEAIPAGTDEGTAPQVLDRQIGEEDFEDGLGKTVPSHHDDHHRHLESLTPSLGAPQRKRPSPYNISK